MIETRKKNHPVTGSKNPFYGKHHTEESKQKMREVNLGRFKGGKSCRSKKVICLNTGEIFNSIAEASEWVDKGKSRQNISTCCKKKMKSAGKHPETKEPLHWDYYIE